MENYKPPPAPYLGDFVHYYSGKGGPGLAAIVAGMPPGPERLYNLTVFEDDGRVSAKQDVPFFEVVGINGEWVPTKGHFCIRPQRPPGR